MPTGGVAPTEESLSQWFNAGVTCVGIGSKLIFKNDKGQYDYEGIKQLTTTCIDVIKKLKT
jgi:2-dehydro-3-deoxyphosphogluconate aldolase/(4S)-4-hydroxy-2-oxoglutarate aldolase